MDRYELDMTLPLIGVLRLAALMHWLATRIGH